MPGVDSPELLDQQLSRADRGVDDTGDRRAASLPDQDDLELDVAEAHGGDPTVDEGHVNDDDDAGNDSSSSTATAPRGNAAAVAAAREQPPDPSEYVAALGLEAVEPDS